jgi:hypothetical protein
MSTDVVNGCQGEVSESNKIIAFYVEIIVYLHGRYGLVTHLVWGHATLAAPQARPFRPRTPMIHLRTPAPLFEVLEYYSCIW